MSSGKPFHDSIDEESIKNAFGDLVDPQMTTDEFREAVFARGLATDDDHDGITWFDYSVFPFSHHATYYKPFGTTFYCNKRVRSLIEQSLLGRLVMESSDDTPKDVTAKIHGIWDLWRKLPKKQKKDVSEPDREGTLYISDNDMYIVSIADQLGLTRGGMTDLRYGDQVSIEAVRSDTPSSPVTRALFLIYIDQIRELRLRAREFLKTEGPVKVLVVPQMSDERATPEDEEAYEFSPALNLAACSVIREDGSEDLYPLGDDWRGPVYELISFYNGYSSSLVVRPTIDRVTETTVEIRLAFPSICRSRGR